MRFATGVSPEPDAEAEDEVTSPPPLMGGPAIGTAQRSSVVWNLAQRLRDLVSEGLEETEPRGEHALLIEGALADLHGAAAALMPPPAMSAA